MACQERGLEIEIWLRYHIAPKDLPDTQILILDDLANFGRLLPWLHRTDPSKGFRDPWAEPRSLGPEFLKPSPCLARTLLPEWKANW